MLSTSSTIEPRAAEVRSRLAAGAFAGLGPVALTTGTLSDAELAARILLAELDHLDTLAKHTGRPPSAERWVRLDDDLRLLLLAPASRPDARLLG